MKCLVTGCAGFIGTNLVSRLLELDDVKIEGVDNLSSSNIKNEDLILGMECENFEYYAIDFSDDAILDCVKDGDYDVVFHLGAIPRVSYSVENPSETTHNNITKTIELMEACKESNTRFIFSSSSSVYGGADKLPTPSDYPKNPKSPYAWQKSAVEDAIDIFVDLYDLDAVSLRYFNVFGPNQYGDSPYSTAVSAWCNAIKEGKSLRSDGDGEQTRDMCYVDNVVDANIRAANYEKRFRGEKLNISCGDRVSNNQILEKFKERFGDIEIVHAPERVGDVKHTQADISETTRLLGYEPMVRFWEGLDRTFEWWKI